MNEMNTDGNTDLVGEILLNPWQAEDHYQTNYQKYNQVHAYDSWNLLDKFKAQDLFFFKRSARLALKLPKDFPV